jgi:AAA+ superfamily predicted ATPase
LESLLTHLNGPVVYSGIRRLHAADQKITVLEPPQLSKAEYISYWQQNTASCAGALQGWLERVVDQFQLDFDDIQNIGTQLVASSNGRKPEHIQKHLWQICRLQARQNMDSLAQRINSVARWEDLVLPEQAIETLKQIAVQVRHKQTVYEQWGFRETSNRGFGISALFAGDSGTGKTMAAEVIANELQLDLYRIDLSQVVNKYIGETEKNLKKVFDSAERSGSILLFDEADALFGKRSDVKDSHDRYANIEISYLLQRMESYNGLAILTTNLRKTIDTAFLRRLRFIVHFPFPDSQDRSRIWARVFPRQTPVRELELNKLARLNITGGNIRNIAMNAAFIAARDNASVSMDHVIQAARAEYIKMDKLLNDSEWRGFV